MRVSEVPATRVETDEEHAQLIGVLRADNEVRTCNAAHNLVSAGATVGSWRIVHWFSLRRGLLWLVADSARVGRSWPPPSPDRAERWHQHHQQAAARSTPGARIAL